MRIRPLVLLFALIGSFLSAHADVIFNGIVTTNSTGGPSCNRFEPGASSISLACSSSNPTATATVTGNGDSFSGSLYVDASQSSSETSGQTAHATASGELDLNQTYVLIGGLGPTTVNFVIASPIPTAPYTPSTNCVFAFDGVSQSCDLEVGGGGGTISEQVEYWVPFSLQFDLTIFAVADTFTDGEQLELVDYSFSEPGLIAIPTPEPSSMLLLLSGVVGIGFAARSRAKGWFGDGRSASHSSR